MVTTRIDSIEITVTNNAGSAVITIPKRWLKQIGLVFSNGRLSKRATLDFNLSSKHGFFAAIYTKAQIKPKNDTSNTVLEINSLETIAIEPTQKREMKEEKKEEKKNG